MRWYIRSNEKLHIKYQLCSSRDQSAHRLGSGLGILEKAWIQFDQNMSHNRNLEYPRGQSTHFVALAVPFFGGDSELCVR